MAISPPEDGELAESKLDPKTKKLLEWNRERIDEFDRRPQEPFPDQYREGRGQSYRPGGARERSQPPVPRADTYRARTPPRRPEYGDSYRAPRPRSRSPPRRDDYRRRTPSPPRYRDARDVRGGDSYRGRARSPPPPRREELPRDDLFRREPEPARDFRDSRDYRDEPREFRDDRDRGFGGARSPPPRYRDRSPLPLKRGREPSPIGSRGRRTPPPAKRERLASPVPRGRYDDYPPSRAASPPRRRYSPEPRERRPSPPRGVTRDYRLRSRSPLARNDKVDPRAVDDWRRPRSPSPPRYARQDYLADETGRNSVATSRRSSPPVHPSRLVAIQPPVDDRVSRPPPRDPYESREPYRARSPEPVKRRDSPPPRQREYAEERGYANGDDRVPPPREQYRADDVPPPRAPPSGPAGYRAPSTPMAPPTGPAAATVSVSAHTRAPAAPPSGPRGSITAPSAPRGDFGPRGRGGFAARGGFGGPFRGGRGGGAPPAFGRGESFNRESFDANAGPPAGPRGSFSGPQAPAFRQGNNSTATTYPRSQRFAPNGQPIPDGPSSTPPTGPRAGRRPTEPALDRRVSGPHPAIADLPKIIEGGQKAEPLVDNTRLNKLQEEAEKLRKQIEEKETRKRKSLREWDRLSREVEVASLRSELAEQSVRELNGEAESQAAF
ncbi:hypothetical protein LTR85_006626 [Meristemomyces frigidus]|nr:hypothetical protein LTR85_006626 [Meristemomyces frigidus]